MKATINPQSQAAVPEEFAFPKEFFCLEFSQQSSHY